MSEILGHGAYLMEKHTYFLPRHPVPAPAHLSERDPAGRRARLRFRLLLRVQ